MKKIALTLFLLLFLSPVFSATDKNSHTKSQATNETKKSSQKDSAFKFLGRPIKPVCMALFNSTKDNYPYVKAINLWRCQFGATFPQKTYKDDKGYYYFYKNNKDRKDGLYSYKLVGIADNGIHVVHTYNASSASNVFDMLLFLQLKKEIIPAYSGSPIPERRVTTYAFLVGYVIGGDRCSGGIKSATVEGNKLMVLQYPKKNSVDQCEGEFDYVINLGRILKSQESRDQ